MHKSTVISPKTHSKKGTFNTRIAGLIIVLSLFIVFGHSAFHPQVTDSKHSISKQQSPTNTPLESDSEPQELSSLDEEVDSDDEIENFFSLASHSNDFATTSSQTSLWFLSRSIQNRPAISLFVLHHSWKSSIA